MPPVGTRAEYIADRSLAGTAPQIIGSQMIFSINMTGSLPIERAADNGVEIVELRRPSKFGPCQPGVCND